METIPEAHNEALTEAPDAAPANAPDGAPAKAPDGAPAKAPDEAPDGAVVKAPDEAPDGAPAEAPAESPSKVSAEAAKEPQVTEHAKQPLVIYLLAICATIGGLLFGYDTGIINGALLVIEDEFDLTDFWKESIVTATVFAAAVFSLCAGVIADKLGRKPTIMIAAIVFTAGGIIMGTAPNLAVLFVGRFTVGAGIGIVSCIVPIYVSECAPKEIRGRLITLNQLFITLGIVISAILAGAFQHVEHGWRIMLGLASVPGFIQFVFFIFLPESPRYLVMKDKVERSKEILRVIRNPDEDINIELDEIIESVIAEKSNTGFQVWKNVMTIRHVRNALIIGCLLQFFQQLCGINTVIYYSATILKSAGFSSSMAIWLSVVPSTVNFLATFLGLWAVESLGRKRALGISFLAIAVACGILSLGFLLGSLNSPSVDVANDKVGSYGDCATHDYCYPCLKDSGENCGYCALNKGRYKDGGSCVELNKSDDKHYYAMKGRCADGNPNDDDFKLLHDYCPNDYAALPLIGLILFVLGFAPGAGPMPWTINAEIYPIWARSVAVGIATFTNWIFNVVVSFSFMSLLRAVRAYGTFFIFLVICVIAAIFVFLVVPETKGLSLEEIEFLFMDDKEKQEFKEKQELEMKKSQDKLKETPSEEKQPEIEVVSNEEEDEPGMRKSTSV